MRWTIVRKFILMLTGIFLIVSYYVALVEHRLDIVSDVNKELSAEWKELGSIIRIDHKLDIILLRLSRLKSDTDPMLISQLSELLDLCSVHLDELKLIQDQQVGADEQFQRDEYDVILAIERQIAHANETLSRVPPEDLADFPELADDLSILLLRVKDQLNEFMEVASSEVRKAVDSVNSAEEEIDEMFRIFMIVLMLVMISIIIFIFTSIIRPIKRLQTGIHRVRQHALPDLPPTSGQDEIAELSETFREMATEIHLFTTGLERRIEERTSELVRSQKLAAVGRLAAGVAHEINNPMTSILACAEGLQRRFQRNPEDLDEETINEYLMTVVNEVRRCKRIVGKLLNLARVKPTNFESVDICALAGQTINLVQYASERNQCTVSMQAPQAPVVLNCDPDQIEQVMLNLMLNAIDACEDRKPAGEVVLRIEANNGLVLFSIADNGCGIPPNDLDRLFEPFFTRKTCNTGTGLGLAVSLGIVEAHGGRIHVDSAGEGKGSCFTVELPRKNPSFGTDNRRPSVGSLSDIQESKP